MIGIKMLSGTAGPELGSKCDASIYVPSVYFTVTLYDGCVTNRPQTCGGKQRFIMFTNNEFGI